MRSILLTTAFLFLAFSSFSQDGIFRNAEVIPGTLVRVTKPLKEMTTADLDHPVIPVRDENGVLWPVGKKPIPFQRQRFREQQVPNDNNVQSQQGSSQTMSGSIGAGWDGIGFSFVNPPDPTICVGPNHVIQMINGTSGALFKIFDKSGGQMQAQLFLDQITLKGGLGDPIALYDQLADRFILTEFANSAETGSEGLIIAVSKTSDPLGQWYVYFFSTGVSFPDYPKFSIWPDAYYATTNNFAPSYVGSSAYAFDRNKMLAGDPTATMQRISMGGTGKSFSTCPVLLQGTTLPAAGTGGLIAYMQDESWTFANDVDSIGLLEFKVNFNNPLLSVITHRSSMAAAPFVSEICGTTRGQCITQPGSTVQVEALHERIMNQPVYRRFGTYEGIVLTHAVNKGLNVSAMRWYELRSTTGSWEIFQQSTYAPDNTHRWMGSVCYDSRGNIALAYNVSSSATGVYPGIRFTGRKACDPPGVMTYAEGVLASGSVANASTRYGDYTHLVCDPDGVTFWYTGEYNNASRWTTRVSSFSLDPCTPAPFVCSAPAVLNTNAVAQTTATITWSSVNGAAGYEPEYKITGTLTWTALGITAATSANLAGLTENTSYDWRVRANCSEDNSSYASSKFTTAPANCDQYEPNNSMLAAVPIPVVNPIQAKIGVAGDHDYFSFYNTVAQSKIKVILSNLPADFDMKLYGPAGNKVKTAAHNGTGNEVIIYNDRKVGMYKIFVYADKGIFNSDKCYTLQVLLSAVNFSSNDKDESNDKEDGSVEIARLGLNIYPVPAKSAVTVAFDAFANGKAEVTLINKLGQVVLKRSMSVSNGINVNTLDISNLNSGIYTLKVQNGQDVKYGKVVKN